MKILTVRDELGNTPVGVQYATPASAGFDIPSNDYDTLYPGECKAIATGLFVAVCEVNDIQEGLDRWGDLRIHMVHDDNKVYDGVYHYEYVPEIQIRSRSGLSLKQIIVLNAPGTIDMDFKGEIKVILMNVGKESFTISKGDRIAQGVCALTLRAPQIPVREASRQGGFGSTGV